MMKPSCSRFCCCHRMLLFAKDKGEIITIQVLGTDAWNRSLTVDHRGTDGAASTSCDTNVSVSDPAGTGTASVNATTNCATTNTPGTPAYATTRNIQQETGSRRCS